jgi:hypothetical protein
MPFVFILPRKKITQLPLMEIYQGKEKKKSFLPLIALIYADQEVLFCFLNQRQSARSAAEISSGFILKASRQRERLFAADRVPVKSSTRCLRISPSETKEGFTRQAG